MNLLAKIASRQARVAVVGMGYVGLPLALAFAEAGFQVVGIDTDEGRVANVNAGCSHIGDVFSDRLKALVTGGRSPVTGTRPSHPGRSPETRGRLSATTDYDTLDDAEAPYEPPEPEDGNGSS